MPDNIGPNKLPAVKSGPSMRAAKPMERVGDFFRNMYEGVAEQPLARIADSIGMTGFQGVANSYADPNAGQMLAGAKTPAQMAAESALKVGATEARAFSGRPNINAAVANDAKGAAILPKYENFTVDELKNRIRIINERGSKRDKLQELPAIDAEIKKRVPIETKLSSSLGSPSVANDKIKSVGSTSLVPRKRTIEPELVKPNTGFDRNGIRTPSPEFERMRAYEDASYNDSLNWVREKGPSGINPTDLSKIITEATGKPGPHLPEMFHHTDTPIGIDVPGGQVIPVRPPFKDVRHSLEDLLRKDKNLLRPKAQISGETKLSSSLGEPPSVANDSGARLKGGIDWGELDPNAGRGMQLVDDAVGPQNNASGSTMASIEALNRNKSMLNKGEKYVVRKHGTTRDLIGPEAVDYIPRSGEEYGIMDALGFRLLNRGG